MAASLGSWAFLGPLLSCLPRMLPGCLDAPLVTPPTWSVLGWRASLVVEVKKRAGVRAQASESKELDMM